LVLNVIYVIDPRLDDSSCCRVEWPRFGCFVLVGWTCMGMLVRQVEDRIFDAEGHDVNTPAVKCI
jgi:hypothetical protein